MTGKSHFFIIILLLSFFVSGMHAQESTSVFNFLSLPNSAHSVALGGKNISLIEDDATLIYQNPALLSSVSDKTAAINFMTYMKGCNTGGAAYVQTQGTHGTWGVTAQFMGYGSMKHTDEYGNVLGSVSALDFALSGMYSYAFNEHWAAGVTGKFIYSHYATYTALGLAVDMGVNYFNEDKNTSVSFVVANLGGQVKAYDNIHERIPFELQLGLTQGLFHMPLRISVTLQDLTHWSKDFYYTAGEDISGFRVFLNHINLGVDYTIINKIWVGLGFNFRRATEMQAAGSSHAAGLTLGAGVNIKRIKFGIGYGKYHMSAPTLAFNLAYSFGK